MMLLRMFIMGRLPPDALSIAKRDEYRLVLENLWSSITFIDFSRGTNYAGWRRQWFIGSLGIAPDRLVAYRGPKRLIHLPFSDPRFWDLDFSRSDNGTIVIEHDAAIFQPTWSGKIQYRFRTSRAKEAMRELLELA